MVRPDSYAIFTHLIRVAKLGGLPNIRRPTRKTLAANQSEA